MVSKAGVFGLYVHIPFCVHRCSYCDFFSSTEYTPESFRTLNDKLLWEARAARAWLEARGLPTRVDTVFFGGGTPSLMPLPELRRLFAGLAESFVFAPRAEITLEANPETVSEAFAAGLVENTPVNRVSLGAQSFSARHLKTLERLGSADSIRTAAARLNAVGISNFNLDLIFGIPGQTADELRADIHAVLEQGPKHSSFYSLTLKPGHRLYGSLPSDDAAAELYEQGRQTYAQYGFEAYEISNFSLPGFESRHNRLYWTGADYLGLGPSAASRFFLDGKFHHRKQIAHFAKYLELTAFEQPTFEVTTADQTILEATFLELRNREGIELARFRRRYGFDLARSPQLPLFVREKMIECDEQSLRLTPKGWLLAEGIATRLLEAAR